MRPRYQCLFKPRPFLNVRAYDVTAYAGDDSLCSVELPFRGMTPKIINLHSRPKPSDKAGAKPDASGPRYTCRSTPEFLFTAAKVISVFCTGNLVFRFLSLE